MRFNSVKIAMYFQIKGIALLFVLATLVIPELAMGQIHYSHHFTKKLNSMAGSFVEPVEGYYKVKMLRRDAYMRYDLVINSEEKEFEMRFLLDKKYLSGTPKISMMTLASSLASNDTHFDIHMHLFPPDLAKNYYAADWAAYADFVPKQSLTDKHYARLLCIYQVDLGLIYQLMLFNQHDEEKNRRLYTIGFGSAGTSTFPGR